VGTAARLPNLLCRRANLKTPPQNAATVGQSPGKSGCNASGNDINPPSPLLSKVIVTYFTEKSKCLCNGPKNRQHDNKAAPPHLSLISLILPDIAA
jgi:hypothetical protein